MPNEQKKSNEEKNKKELSAILRRLADWIDGYEKWYLKTYGQSTQDDGGGSNPGGDPPPKPPGSTIP